MFHTIINFFSDISPITLKLLALFSRLLTINLPRLLFLNFRDLVCDVSFPFAEYRSPSNQTRGANVSGLSVRPQLTGHCR